VAELPRILYHSGFHSSQLRQARGLKLTAIEHVESVEGNEALTIRMSYVNTALFDATLGASRGESCRASIANRATYAEFRDGLQSPANPQDLASKSAGPVL
jgi:hypothetical protein